MDFTKIQKKIRLKSRKIVQNRELRFTGLSRSGNHAIINWVIKQLPGSYCFLNCTEPKHNPFSTARPLNDAGEVFETNIEHFNLQAHKEGDLVKKEHLLYSHEDCFLGPLHHKTFRNNHDSWVGASEKFSDVLILRDPFNLFASRIKAGLITGQHTHHGARPISLRTLRRIYKQHAKAFLGEKDFLKNKLTINYNRWASSLDYRRKVAAELEIPFSDNGFEEVAGVAGGSSFDGIEHWGKASSMKLHSRWKNYSENERFWDLFDEELVELSRRIFGEIPPVAFYREQFQQKPAFN